MKRRFSVRSRMAIAASCAGLFGGSLSAQVAPPAPLPALPAAADPAVVPADAPPPIEIYYGTKKVTPKPPQPVEPAGAVEVITTPAVTPAPLPVTAPTATPSPGDAARTADAFIETLRDFRTGSHRVGEATLDLLGKVVERTRPAEPKHVIVTNYATPASLPALSNANAPWLNAPAQNLPGGAPVIIQAPAAATSPVSPNVVVIREPIADAKPAAVAPEPVVPVQGVVVSQETLIAAGIAVGCAFLALLSWSRSGRGAVAVAEPQTIYAPVTAENPNSIRLQGQYNAGELPTSAEKFEIGASYQDDLRQKRLTEESNNSAAVEFILSQNLELLAQLNPGTDPTAAVVDHGGYALPAETPPPSDDEFTFAVRPAVAG